MQKCEVCGREFRNLAQHTRMAHSEKDENPRQSPNAGSTVPPEGTGSPGPDSEIKAMLGQVVGIVSALDQRLTRIETGGVNDFKRNPNAMDVEAAEESKKRIPPRIVKIVEETLGEDFSVDVKEYQDQPGFEFTVIVPPRLTTIDKALRPVLDPASAHPLGYKIDEHGEVMMEEFQPADRRSRAIAALDSYDRIREHCERVRANIIATYQKLNRPVPEFRLKNFV